LISLMLFTLGYVIWDRRTALNPVQKTTISLKEKVNKLESILKKKPKPTNILQKYCERMVYCDGNDIR
ncbi:MAG: hypothetical protein K8R58_12965, partial [Bacteroidales bacterium]|nr:hypothetical protein [Bacteroidales bacterium]